jgi:uncharacterized ion transporter superfamily protein YfcC
MTTDEFDRGAAEREQALRQLEKRRGFRRHLVVFVVVNAAVWVIWAVSGTGYPWPAWLTGLWALGLVTNAWDVFFRRRITERDVEREIRHLHPTR